MFNCKIVVYLNIKLNQTKKQAMKTFTQNEILKISKNMIRFGGSFHRCIGEALSKADKENTQKLINAFYDEMQQYLKY